MATKDKIIEVSIDLFSRQGYTETSLREIAAAIGIKASSIYNHFASKEAILDVIFDLFYQKMYERVAPREEIDRMIDLHDARTILNSALFYLEETEQTVYSKILKIVLQEQYRNEQAGDFVRRVLYAEVEDYLCFVLTRLCEAGKLRISDPALYARVINSVNVATIVEYAHYTPAEYFETHKLTRLEITNRILDGMYFQSDLAL